MDGRPRKRKRSRRAGGARGRSLTRSDDHAPAGATKRRVREVRRRKADRETATGTAKIERELLAALVRSIPDEVWFADTRRRFTLANPAALREFALEKRGRLDVEGFAASLEVLRPDGTPRPVEEAPPLRALEGETIVGEEELIRTPASGELRWRQVSASPVKDAGGSIVGSVSVVRDITQRKRAELALQDSRNQLELRVRERTAELTRTLAALDAEHRRFQDVLDMLPAYIILLTPDHRVPLANRYFEERFGKADGRRCYEYLFGRTSPCESCETFKVFETRSPHHWLWTGPDGRDYDVHDFPFVDDDGSSLVMEMGIDVTERKRTEAALRDLNETLERRVAERTSALQQVNERLEEADRRKNEFLATLSHELRNPLAPISNSLYVLDRAPAGGNQARRAKEVIERQIAHLSHLVNDLLDVTRISRNKIQLHRVRADLRDVVRGSVEDQRSLFEDGELEIDVDLPKEPIFVEVDTTRIGQVVGNLLQNAAKFTPRGGTARIDVSADPRRGHGVVRVTDTGIGMTAETIAGLFHPFVQADHTLDRSGGGLGLGLALVKGLVELHGGEVAAHSDGLGRGSEFVVRLPIDVAPEPRVGPAHAPPPPSRRILVIEDNLDAAASLRDALELDGHEVFVANDGPEGIAKARECRPGFVLCDIGLPGMDGYAVARAFRADDALRDVHLVALSGYARPEDLQRSAEAGFERHIAKPPSLAALAAILGGSGRA